MSTPICRRFAHVRTCRVVALGALAAAIVGCGPDYNAIANRLRETNLQQQREISGLKEDLSNRDATIRDLQARLAGGLPPLQTLPPNRLAELFTASRLEIRAQTDAQDLGDGKGIDGFRVFIRTISSDGQIIPATGALTIEAFELPLSPGEPRRVGAWTFTPEEMKKNWYGGLGMNHFALNCPWSSPPARADVTFRARLVDALTGQTLETQLDKKVTLASR